MIDLLFLFLTQKYSIILTSIFLYLLHTKFIKGFPFFVNASSVKLK